jgi:hypothetical protein
MRNLLIIPLLALLVGCASFSTHVFRTEQTAVTLAYGSYLSWTNYLLTTAAKPDLTPQQRMSLTTASNEVKQARLRFAATVGTIEAMRLSYETNAVLKKPLEAGIASMIDQGSNIVWLIRYYRSAQ